ncbi:MAG: vWA domain-containing protein [Bdellovibrionota bacterium]
MVAQVTPEPENGTVRIWERDAVPRGNNQDLVVARSPLELPRMLLMPRPGEPLFAPLFEGRQFALGTQREMPSREPTRVLERKLLVVFLDVSGSMQSNSRITVLNDLITVLLDYAMRETDRRGRPLTQVIFVPFESSLAEGTPVESMDAAYALISQILSHSPPYKAGGGTDIEGALVSFYDAVKTSYQNTDATGPKRDLKRATAVFLTDGGSNVSLENIAKAREGLPSDVDIFVNFIAIGESNAELETICKASNLGTTAPMVRTILDNEIVTLLQLANQWKVDAAAFATSHSLLPPPSLLRELSALSQEPLSLVTFESDTGIAAARRRIHGTQAGRGGDRGVPPMVSTLAGRWRKDATLEPVLRRKLVAALFTLYAEWMGWENGVISREEKNFFIELLRWSGEEG